MNYKKCKSSKISSRVLIVVGFILIYSVGYSVDLQPTEISNLKLLFNQSVELYSKGEYSAAREILEKINTQLIQNQLYCVGVLYNLGNCYFRENKLGWARYYYELAKLLDYHDADVNHNLYFVKKVSNNLEMENVLTKIFYFFSLKELYIGLLLFNIMFFLTLIVSTFYTTVVVRRWRIIFFVGFVFFLICFIIRYNQNLQKTGIVVEPTNLTSEPREILNIKSIPLSEARKVVVLTQKDDYYAIYLPKEKIQGWVKKDSVRIVKL